MVHRVDCLLGDGGVRFTDDTQHDHRVVGHALH